MTPSDYHDAAGPAPTRRAPDVPAKPPQGMPGQGVGAAAAGVRDPLRGLADPAPVNHGPQDGPARPSLWVRIKRAFQYGSQGGETS